MSGEHAVSERRAVSAVGGASVFLQATSNFRPHLADNLVWRDLSASFPKTPSGAKKRLERSGGNPGCPSPSRQCTGAKSAIAIVPKPTITTTTVGHLSRASIDLIQRQFTPR